MRLVWKPRSIDIKSKAQNGDVVINIRCVGCGHCIDVCPVKTLGYSTKFLNWILNKIKQMILVLDHI